MHCSNMELMLIQFSTRQWLHSCGTFEEKGCTLKALMMLVRCGKGEILWNAPVYVHS